MRVRVVKDCLDRDTVFIGIPFRDDFAAVNTLRNKYTPTGVSAGIVGFCYTAH